MMEPGRLAALSGDEKLKMLEREIESGTSAELSVYLHGLLAGEMGLTAEESMPPKLPSHHRGAWERCHWRGTMCRTPATAKLPANPARAAEKQAADAAARRDWELDADLLG